MKTKDFIQHILNLGGEEDCSSVVFLKGLDPNMDHFEATGLLIESDSFDTRSFVFSSGLCSVLNKELVDKMFKKHGSAYGAREGSIEIQRLKYLEKVPNGN